MNNSFNKYSFLLFSVLLFSINALGQQKNQLIKQPKVIFKNALPVEVRDCWHNLDIEKDTLAGTSLIRAYKEIIKNKKGKEVIVAVIDTDIDINHEDLKSAIWVNKREIPNNGIDDDKNGYVDDVNGWNFLGNKNGESISYANTEPIRIINRMKKKYNSFNNFNGNKKDSLLNIKAKRLYKEDSLQLETQKKYSSLYIDEYKRSVKKLELFFGKRNYSFPEIDSLYHKNKKGNPELVENILILRKYIRLGMNEATLKKDSLKVIKKQITSFNLNYNDRHIIGDNDLDLSDRFYGNNDVFKNVKLTYHGTIVSGILGANRANKKGIQGFSDNIKIMPILAIPTGGYENDKDVALAIKYAVDNGARIINMSFGKTFSANPEWVKEALEYAEKHDVLVIAAAGNDSSNSDLKPFYPIDYNEKTMADYCDNFIKVGGITYTGDSDFLASFTNYGKKTVDVFAPAYFLKTTDANVGYAYRDGTSMSSPIVSGVAAIVRSHYPKLSAKEVKEILLESSVKYDLEVQVPGEAKGTLKPFKELSKTGGVINAYNALLIAKEWKKSKK
ncbi:S8 family serine peptidase [Flavobacterium amniphilum]|uniref:S8 family serine peptidase n=1 Tax=Flavobacterium amniphilum TaxID=1834035 RepID=UPI00202A68F8|nr:S8 family serine peptidase [Flavobacterium amniphilum]MCL9807437.1 S8 family serine peptidase [Flavobacterium amniphilum]